VGSYGSLSPLMLWVRLPLRARCITLCDKVCQWVAAGLWFSPGPPVSSTNKTDRHDITEILLKVVLNTIKPKPRPTKLNKPSQIECKFDLQQKKYSNTYACTSSVWFYINWKQLLTTGIYIRSYFNNITNQPPPVHVMFHLYIYNCNMM
jgi:hypothetical protein